MAEIPEELLRRSAEAKAKALGLPVEQVLAEMKGEAPPAAPEPAEEPAAEEPATAETPDSGPQTPAEPVSEANTESESAPEPEPAAAEAAATEPATADAAPVDTAALLTAAAEKGGLPESLVQRSAEAKAKATGASVAAVLAEMAGVPTPAAAASSEPAPAETPAAETPDTGPETSAEPAPDVEVEAEPAAPAAAVAVAEASAEESPPPSGNGGGNGAARVAASVTPRPIATPSPGPEGVRTQRLLTVVKAKAIQKTKPEPADKVSTWPHLMVAEFAALMAVTAVLIVMSVVLQAPLLEQANFNATPNPSKAPWYFLGLQELLSYFDPQIAGVTIPTIVGLLGFMAIPYVDRNPSNKPADRKFAIFLYTFFIMGAGVLTILGVLFRGPGFNFTYPWADGIWFDDLKDWVNFE